MLLRIVVAAVLAALLSLLPDVSVLPLGGVARGLLYYIVVYVIIGYDILYKALLGIRNSRVFDENFLMAVATLGAFALALYEQSGDYLEAIAVMLFYQVGELFQSYAVGKSRRNIAALMDIRPDYANIEQADGSLERVDPDDVEAGQVIVVQPGEKVPIDGIVEKGRSTLNTAALTGESLPREAGEGDEVISGSINMTGQGVRRIHGFEDSGTGGRQCFPQVAFRRFHHALCPRLYPCRLLCSPGPGPAPPAGAPVFHGCRPDVEPVGLSRPDIPRHQLPLCLGGKHPAVVLCRHRRSQP